MKTTSLVKALLLTALSLTFPNLALTQNPPARTYQPGPWQPVARVDTSRPIQILIFNHTDILLDYDLTSNINPSPRRLMPGETATLKGFTIPAYILVNRSISASGSVPINLKYEVRVDENNVVKLTVTKVSDDAEPGYSTFNLNKEGAIYIY
jgi:hypothetical protein